MSTGCEGDHGAAMGKKERNRLLIHNRYEAEQELWIEPWGDRIVMPAGSSYLVVGEGPPGGSLELDLRPDGFAVYGWGGSTLSVGDERGGVVWRSPVPVPTADEGGGSA